MRTREEIEAEVKELEKDLGDPTADLLGLQIELLLDIREYLRDVRNVLLRINNRVGPR